MPTAYLGAQADGDQSPPRPAANIMSQFQWVPRPGRMVSSQDEVNNRYPLSLSTQEKQELKV